MITITVIFLAVALYLSMSNEASAPDLVGELPEGVSIYPISHASFVLKINDTTFFNDPVGETSLYETYGTPDVILLSDIHSDHLDVQTLTVVAGENTVIVAPVSMQDKLPLELQEKIVVMSNDDIHQIDEISIEAIPMYNLPPSPEAYHVKGRGNGYVLEWNGTKIYIAGDTADIPEMRELENINIAFVPMNLPYTMDVDVAADAVLDFAPKIVYPYHYRGTEGLSDINEFKRLVSVGNPNIEVRTPDWYSNKVEVEE